LKNLLISVFDFFFVFLVFFTLIGLLLVWLWLVGLFTGVLIGVFTGVWLVLFEWLFAGVFFALGDRFTVSLCFLAL